MMARATSTTTVPGTLPRLAPGGFTLLELVIVVGILAIVAGAVMLSLDRVHQEAAAGITQHDLDQLRQAILRFYQDTGWLPGQGPFALVGDHPLGQLDPNNPLHWPSWLASATAAQRAAWARHPGNWWQLVYNPLVDRNGQLIHPLGRWNPATRRGWRGPYLSLRGGGLVDLSRQLDRSGAGDPAAGTTADVVPRCVAPGDPFSAPPLGPFFQWYDPNSLQPRPRWGRPYLMFDLHHGDPVILRARARVVGLGPNGIYESSPAGPGGDDVVVFLFR